jgi:hypothetical protein
MFRRRYAASSWRAVLENVNRVFVTNGDLKEDIQWFLMASARPE